MGESKAKKVTNIMTTNRDFTKGLIYGAISYSTYEHLDCNDCIEGRCNPPVNDGNNELSDQCREKLQAIADAAYPLLEQYINADNVTTNEDPNFLAGRHLWATGQGHGIGFWDGDWANEVKDEMTKIAKNSNIEDLHFYIDSNNELSLE